MNKIKIFILISLTHSIKKNKASNTLFLEFEVNISLYSRYLFPLKIFSNKI